MSTYEIEYDDLKRITHIRVRGQDLPGEPLERLRSVHGDPNWHEGYDVIHQYIDPQPHANSGDALSVVSETKRLSGRIKFGRLVIVNPDPATKYVGEALMAASDLIGERTIFRVRSLQEAYGLLAQEES